MTFDPSVLSFRDLLGVFFTIHDPTTLNRQGGDVGTQYRSVVFYNSPEQRATAEEVIAELSRNHVWDDPIVTQLAAATTFYPAEEYHQDYYAQNPGQGYCQIVIAPKVAKFRKAYLDPVRRRDRWTGGQVDRWRQLRRGSSGTFSPSTCASTHAEQFPSTRPAVHPSTLNRPSLADLLTPHCVV